VHRPLDRAIGILLFLPVPLVLVLFTRAPFGILPSFAIGIVLMLTHRLYARPWAAARAGTRCLWCGGAAAGGPALAIREPVRSTVAWRACRPGHADRVLRVLSWAERHAVLLKAGILGGLAVLFAGTALASRGMAGSLRPGDAAHVFRVMVALAVLPLGWLGPSGKPHGAGTAAPPFPVHIQALIGSYAVVWLFRLVGAWWLVDGVLRLARVI
jgi:hypothetical protein